MKRKDLFIVPWEEEPQKEALPEPEHDILLSRINKVGDCWIWTGSINDKGFGRASYKGKKYMAHRLSWITFKGEIPKNMYVYHTCNNRPCINPDHLYLKLIEPKPKNRKRLTEEQVRKIRQRYKAKSKLLAEEYGVSVTAINNIKARRTWKEYKNVIRHKIHDS